MKQKIIAYKVFTSLGYRIAMFAVLPLVLLGVQIFVLAAYRGTGIPLFAPALIIVEIMADNWFLGGIQEKNSQKIDYLKTSARGMKVMRNVLVTDVARRLLSCAGILGLCQGLAVLTGVSGEREITLLTFMTVLFAAYFLSALGVFIARFFSYLWVNMICGYIGSVAGLVACMIWITMPPPAALAAVILVCLLVLSAGISVLMVKIAMIKEEGSYYDR